MAILSRSEIHELLEPFYPEASDVLLSQLSDYLDLLIKWNARMNLTAIRDPAQIVRRHFGESLFAARNLPECVTLLDLGSGAGFPGLPIQLARPELHVMLAESQKKKATFLSEVVRSLGLQTEVWAARAETLPQDRRFDVVTLRAVDDPSVALNQAFSLVKKGGFVVHLTTSGAENGLPVPIPCTNDCRMIVYEASDGIVPRGTKRTLIDGLHRRLHS